MYHTPLCGIGCLNPYRITILGEKYPPKNFSNMTPPAPHAWVPLSWEGLGVKTWLAHSLPCGVCRGVHGERLHALQQFGR